MATIATATNRAAAAATRSHLDDRRDSKQRDDALMAAAAADDKPDDAIAPPELQHAFESLEQSFAVDTAKLKQIVDRFEEELYLGLARISRCLLPSIEPEDGEGSIPMNVTYVQGWPTGKEFGDFLTIDLGDNILRICWVALRKRRGDTKVDQQTYQIPEEYKKGEADPLFTFLVDSIKHFLQSRNILDNLEQGQLIPLGFTFSFPVTQEEIDHGVLQSWTKGFDIDGIEGHDVAAQLRQYLNENRLPIKLVALVNDTTGAMIASHYRDPHTVIGAIFGTGCNAAYFEHCRDIPKISGMPPDQLMAINCEYGAFDNEHLVLPRTKYDIQLDEDSPRPGEQAFEKMSAGLYLGELFRRALLDLAEQRLLFQGQSIEGLRKPYILDTEFLACIDNDHSVEMQSSERAFHSVVGIQAKQYELHLARRLAQAIAIRGARLCCCGVAAICRKKQITHGHVAADGSVANKHPGFKKRWAEALGEVLDWPAARTEDPIIITAAEDGSSIGAAVISAMAPTWPRQKDRRGGRQSIGGAEASN